MAQAGLGVHAFDPPRGHVLRRGDHRSLAAAPPGRGFDRVVIGGGDGTLNAAIPGLLKAGLPFGIMPLGTANDLARSLGIPFELDAAAQVIAERRAASGRSRRGQRPSVFQRRQHRLQRRARVRAEGRGEAALGQAGYGVAALGLLRRARPFTVTLIHDGLTEQVRTIQVSVGNGRHYGGGMTVAEDARPDDGVLDVYSLEVGTGGGWWRCCPGCGAAPRAAVGDVRAFRTTALELRTRRPRPVNTDGELTTHTPASFRLRPAALRVFAPAAEG